MRKGLGLAAVQERIRKSFLEVHNDQRTREQREADEAMLATIAPRNGLRTSEEQRTLASFAKSSICVSSGATERRMNAYLAAALRSPKVSEHAPRRNNVHHAWVVEVPVEDAATLISQALRYLERT